jgi:hypothetical protein
MQCPTQAIHPAFSMLIQRLQRGKQLVAYTLESGHQLIALDGSQYFSSEKINCPSCLTYQKTKGSTRYAHQMLQAVMLNPHMRQVLPMAPEPVANTDGNTKQDCEINAAKRIVTHIRTAHPKLKMVITADGLYSKQPFIDGLKANRMSLFWWPNPPITNCCSNGLTNSMGLDKAVGCSSATIKGAAMSIVGSTRCRSMVAAMPIR